MGPIKMTSASMTTNDILTISVIVRNTNNEVIQPIEAITVETSDASIALADVSNAVITVTPLKVGSVVITARCGNVSVSMSITVSEDIASIEFDDSTLKVSTKSTETTAEADAIAASAATVTPTISAASVVSSSTGSVADEVTGSDTTTATPTDTATPTPTPIVLQG